MRIYQSFCAIVVAALALFVSQTASAEYETVTAEVLEQESLTLTATEMSLEDRIKQLESRLSMIESNPVGSSCNSCPIPSRRIDTNTLRCPKHYAGFELAVLKAHTGSLAFTGFGGSGAITPEYDYEGSPRIYLGREGCSGLGYRISYFQFDHTADDPTLFGVTTGLEIHALDIELTSRTEFCGCDTMLTAGFRYGDLESNVNAPGLGGEILRFSSDGVGPTIGGSLRRDLGQTPWDLIVGGRASLLLTDTALSIPTLVTIDATDSTMQVWEGRIGVERTRQLRRAQLVTQFSFEAQNWQSGSIAGLISPSFALAGPTFRVGLNF